jgi:hypothetical protein
MHFVDELLPEALIAAPGCPETVVERMLRVAATDFYRASLAWRVTTEVVPVIAGRRDVELELPADTTPLRLYWVRLDDAPLDAISERNLPPAREGTPTGYAKLTDHTLRLDRVPQVNYRRNGLVAHLAVTPTVQCDDLPDELFYAHRDGILSGGVARLMAMPNVLWSNPALAQAHYALMAGHVTRARREADALSAPVVRKVRYGGL